MFLIKNNQIYFLEETGYMKFYVFGDIVCDRVEGKYYMEKLQHMGYKKWAPQISDTINVDGRDYFYTFTRTNLRKWDMKYYENGTLVQKQLNTTEANIYIESELKCGSRLYLEREMY